MVDYVGASVTEQIDGSVHDGQSPFRAMLTLTNARASGLVGLRGADGTFAFRIQNGQLLQTASTQQCDDAALLHLVIGEGLMTAQDLRPVVEHCEATGARLSRTLHSRGFMPPSELLRLFRIVHAARLSKALTLRGAWLTFGPTSITGQAASGEVAPLDLRLSLGKFLKDALLGQYHRDLEPLMAPVMWRFVRVAAEKQDLVDALRFTKRERHAIESTLTGEYQLADAIRVSILSKNESARLLLLLFAFDAVECSTERMAGEEEDLGKVVEETAHRMKRYDHFTRLEGHWATHPDDLEEGYRRLLRRYGAMGKYGRDENTAEIAVRICGMVEESWKAIRDRQRRMEYRKVLVEPSQLRHSADLLWAQAETADFRSDGRAARLLRDIVDELAPELAMRKRAEMARTRGGQG